MTDIDADLLADLTAEVEGSQAVEASRRPKWTPQVVESDNEAEAVSGVYEHRPDEIELIRGWNLDPDDWQIIDGTLVVNRWQAMTSRQRGNELVWLHQYKARLRRRRCPRVELGELLKDIGRYKPVKAKTRKDPVSLVVALADWQIGKADGDGVEGTIHRILDSAHGVYDRARDVKASEVVVVGMGDLIEQCSGNYSSQAFTVELNRREQLRVARRLLRDQFILLSKLGVPIVGGGVGGNHGENRQNGKAYTGPGDNDDVMLFENVAEVLAVNDAFSHIRWCIPKDRLYINLEVQGKRVGFTHGHLSSRGATPQQKQRNWWADQAFGDTPIGDADYLVTGHYHHLSVVDHGPRVHFQCPAQDGGSRWWEDATGARSAAGTLTFVVTPDGWDELRVV